MSGFYFDRQPEKKVRTIELSYLDNLAISYINIEEEELSF